VEINIRPFIYEKDLENVYRLYETVYGAKALACWKRRWRWQYLQNPAAETAKAGMWVAEREDGAILGFQGSFPQRLKLGEEVIISDEAGDLAVHKKARRHGLGTKFTVAIMDNRTHLLMAYNYSPATGRICCRLGCTPVSCVPWYLRPTDLHSIFHYLLESKRIPSWVGKRPLVYLIAFGCEVLNLALAGVNHLKRPLPSPLYTIEEVTQAGSEFDDLWQEISPQFPIIFVRDAKFVKWRFLDDPGNKHTLLAARDQDGKLRGYLDITVSDIQGLMVGRIMDLFCPPQEHALADTLLAEAFEIFKQREVALTTCMGLHPAHRKKVRRYLYVKPRRHEAPALLHWKAEPTKKAFAQNSENWHLSHADGDLLFFDRIPYYA
jgi:GNAT superfamily N-acetyltransferase